VTHFEKTTREEIACRNYTEGTVRAYLRALHDLAGYFQQPRERLEGPPLSRAELCGCR